MSKNTTLDTVENVVLMPHFEACFYLPDKLRWEQVLNKVKFLLICLSEEVHVYSTCLGDMWVVNWFSIYCVWGRNLHSFSGMGMACDPDTGSLFLLTMQTHKDVK